MVAARARVRMQCDRGCIFSSWNGRRTVSLARWMGVADLSAVEEALDTEKQGTCVTTDNCPDPSPHTAVLAWGVPVALVVVLTGSVSIFTDQTLFFSGCLPP